MKRSNCLLLPAVLSAWCVTSAPAQDTLDTLLPRPYQFRSRAEELNVDAETQRRIEQLYKAAEPKYHELKYDLAQLTDRLHDALVDDEFDRDAIEERMEAVLDAENELKLYQVGVRIRLLSQVTVDQLRQARDFARQKADQANWGGDIMAGGELDRLLPRPFWLRSRAEELAVDAKTRRAIEETYKYAESKYHELKAKVDPLKVALLDVLAADDLDRGEIVDSLSALLEAEKQLKMFQVHVRTSLLAQVSAEQRRAARQLVLQKPEADWQKVMAEKVEHAGRLSQQLRDSGQRVTDVEKQMSSIEKTIAGGKVTEGARRLDQTIRELEKRLRDAGQQP